MEHCFITYRVPDSSDLLLSELLRWDHLDLADSDWSQLCGDRQSQMGDGQDLLGIPTGLTYVGIDRGHSAINTRV